MEMRKVWVEDCQLPGHVYDLALARMPEPTEAKWQIMYNVCFGLLQLFTVNVQHLGFRATMIEEFISKLFDYVRGTADKARPQDAGKHACRQKLVAIGGIIRNLELPAAIHLLRCHTGEKRF